MSASGQRRPGQGRVGETSGAERVCAKARVGVGEVRKHLLCVCVCLRVFFSTEMTLKVKGTLHMQMRLLGCAVWLLQCPRASLSIFG